MTFRTGHIASLLFLALLVSCNKEAGGGPEPQGSAMPIALTAGLADTKGQAETTTLSLQTSGLGLFAWRTDAGTYFNGEEPYLENQEFSYDGASSTWKSPDVWWPLGSWLSFFAYAPYQADVSSAPLVYPSEDYSGGLPRFTYTPELEAADQKDLVISAPVLDRSVSEGTVPLNFYHVLTKVLFQARWTSSDPSQYDMMLENEFYVHIKSLTLNNILGENSLTYKRNGYSWDALTGATLASLATSSYTLSMENGCLAPADSPDTEVPLLDPDDPSSYYAAYVTGDDYGNNFAIVPESVLYLLPQALTPDATLEVVYGVYEHTGVQSGDDIVREVAIGELPNYIWPAGFELTYSLTLDLAGAVIVDAKITFNCNAGTFVSPGEVDFGSSDAGSFLGGSFDLDNTSPGSFAGNGESYTGSTAGGFIDE